MTTGIFLLTKFLILRHADSLRRGLIAIPFYFAITIFINVFSIIFKGSPGLNLSKLPIGAILGISFGIAGFVFLWCHFFMRPYLRRKLENDEPLRWYHCLYIPFVKPKPPLPHHDTELSEKIDPSNDGKTPLSPDALKTMNLEEALGHRQSQETIGHVDSGLAALDDTPKKSRAGKMFNKFKAKATKGLNKDISANSQMDSIHDNSTKYHPVTERLFCTLQVLTSCFASFAHGSNDVANAIGPLTTIFYVW